MYYCKYLIIFGKKTALILTIKRLLRILMNPQYLARKQHNYLNATQTQWQLILLI